MSDILAEYRLLLAEEELGSAEKLVMALEDAKEHADILDLPDRRALLNVIGAARGRRDEIRGRLGL